MAQASKKAAAKTAKTKAKTPDKASKIKDKSSVNDVKVLATFIRDLSFECPAPALKPLAKGEQQLDFRLSAGARKIVEKGALEQAEVTLHLRAVATHKTGAPLFVCEMAYSGLVEWENSLKLKPEDVVWGVAPAQIYPKARQAMLQTLVQSGFVPPLPDSIDFASLREQVK